MQFGPGQPVAGCYEPLATAFWQETFIPNFFRSRIIYIGLINSEPGEEEKVMKVELIDSRWVPPEPSSLESAEVGLTQ